jgi:hypothetical protein
MWGNLFRDQLELEPRRACFLLRMFLLYFESARFTKLLITLSQRQSTTKTNGVTLPGEAEA